MTTAQKLWLGFGLLTGIMIMVVVVVFSWVSMIGDQLDAIAIMAGPASQASHRLEFKANQLTAEVSAYLRSADPVNRVRTEKHVAEFEQQLSAYREYVSTAAEQELADQTRDIFDRYHAMSLIMLEEKDQGMLKPADFSSLLELRVELDEVLDQAQLVQEARIEPAREQVSRSIGRLRGAMLLLLASGLAVTLLTSLAIGRGILSTEEALRESGIRNAGILENALDGIITIDAEGNILEFNPAAERIFGYGSEEVMGREMAELIIPEEYREAHRMGLANQVSSAKSNILGQRLELSALRNDGQQFEVEVAIVRIGNSKTPMFTGFLRDISQRKQAEVDLTERMKLLQLGTDVGAALTKGDDIQDVLHGCTEAIVKHIDAAFSRIWLIDETGEWLHLKASSGMYEHLDGDHGTIRVGEFKIGRIAQQRTPHLTNHVIGDPQVPEQEWAQREGMVAFAGYPLMVDRRVVGVLGMFFKQPLSSTVVNGLGAIANEIAIGIRHELAQIELLASYEQLEDRVQERTEDLHTSNQALVRSNHELEQFASVASHDLQEPLRKIQAFGERLQTKYAEKLDEQGQQYIDRMHTSALRMRRLIDDLLSFSRVTTKARPFEPVDMAEIAEEVVSDLEARINDTGGKVELQNLPTIDADPLQIRQLLQNLISNGLKFHRPEVPPVVTVEAQIDAADADFYLIRVSDNGIGFEETYLDRIFEVFQRLHGRLEYEGTGMGLAICRKITERHGGSITAESKPGSGSAFIMRLPKEQPEPETVV